MSVHAAGARRTDFTGGLRRSRSACCRTLRFDLGLVGGLDRQSGAQSRDIRRDAACDGRHRADRAVYRRKTRKGDRRGARRRGRRVRHSRRVPVRAARAVRTADLGAHAGAAGGARAHDRLCAYLRLRHSVHRRVQRALGGVPRSGRQPFAAAVRARGLSGQCRRRSGARGRSASGCGRCGARDRARAGGQRWMRARHPAPQKAAVYVPKERCAAQ